MQRYSEFLSLIVVDLKSLKKFALSGKTKYYRNPEGFFIDLEKLIKNSVRETDIVSGFENDKLGLLLSETPEDGADCLVKRLDENLKCFVSNYFKVPHEWRPCYEIVSFPEKEDAREEFSSFVQNNFLSGK